MVSRVVAVCTAIVVAIIPAMAAASPLRSGDRVMVTVFNHPELAIASATIDGDGDLAMPVAGNVVVAGLEPTVAAAHITAALRPYLRFPTVSLAVLEQNTTISLVGGPNSSMPYVPGQTLSSVISSLALTPGLDFHHVTIARDGALLGSYDALNLLQTAQPGPLLQPGDRVSIAQKPVAVTVIGIVKTPGATYLDSGASIADAVYAAGGVGNDAAIGGLELLRDGHREHLALASTAAHELARSGDVITVPQALHVAVSGRVAHPGDTPLINGTTLFAAIYQAGGPIQYGDVSHTLVVHDGEKHVYDITKVPAGDTSQNPQLAEGDVIFVPTGNHIDFGDLFSGANLARLFF
jgi:protein involved in polysaccharide export with SLBB domain